MRIDFTETKSRLDKFARESEQVVEKYDNAEWEDEVRDSYIPYISQCKETVEAVRSIKSNLDEAERQAGCVEESANVMQAVDSIKSQTDAIVV